MMITPRSKYHSLPCSRKRLSLLSEGSFFLGKACIYQIYGRVTTESRRGSASACACARHGLEHSTLNIEHSTSNGSQLLVTGGLMLDAFHQFKDLCVRKSRRLIRRVTDAGQTGPRRTCCATPRR